jgi:hypothetical protein
MSKLRHTEYVLVVDEEELGLAAAEVIEAARAIAQEFKTTDDFSWLSELAEKTAKLRGALTALDRREQPEVFGSPEADAANLRWEGTSTAGSAPGDPEVREP